MSGPTPHHGGKRENSGRQPRDNEQLRYRIPRRLVEALRATGRPREALIEILAAAFDSKNP
jgi:hypothetical protein